MQRNGQQTAQAVELEERLDLILGALPGEHVVAHLGVARFCFAHSGAFVIAPLGGSIDETAATIHSLAEHTRRVLAEHLSWIPFLDALVACPSGDTHQSLAASAVPIDLLASTLLEGPAVVDEIALTAVRNLLRDGRFDGWRPGTPSSDGRIDLCEPASPPFAS